MRVFRGTAKHHAERKFLWALAEPLLMMVLSPLLIGSAIRVFARQAPKGEIA